MDEPAPSTPRWGNQSRDRKALAILRTLQHHCGAAITDGAWLDVGCGSGGIAATLSESVERITGVDPEPWKTWTDLIAAHANLKLLSGSFDGAQPPLEDASINVAVCNQVYEHVSDPVALLRNIHRVLVPGGVCYFAGPNLLWPIEPHVFWPLVHWLPRLFAQRIMRMLGSRHSDDLDAYSRSYPTLVSWFRKLGFAHETALRGRMLATLDSRKMSAFSILVRCIPNVVLTTLMPLAPGFVFILRK